MKSLIAAIIILFFTIGCSISKSTLKGKYQETPFQIESSKSFEETWSKLIDLFAQKGLSIKIIDKSSGLITSEKTSFLSSYTYENEQIKPNNPNAFIILAKVSYGGRVYAPTTLTGEWNVRIKQAEGKTIINVNLVNIIALFEAPSSKYSRGETVEMHAKSTGVFERLIAEQLR